MWFEILGNWVLSIMYGYRMIRRMTKPMSPFLRTYEISKTLYVIALLVNNMYKSS